MPKTKFEDGERKRKEVGERGLYTQDTKQAPRGYVSNGGEERQKRAIPRAFTSRPFLQREGGPFPSVAWISEKGTPGQEKEEKGVLLKEQKTLVR